MRIFGIFKKKENKKDIDFTDIIMETIEDLMNNKDVCTLTDGMKLENGEVAIQESMPSEKLDTFIRYFYSSNLSDMNYAENMEKIKI